MDFNKRAAHVKNHGKYPSKRQDSWLPWILDFRRLIIGSSLEQALASEFDDQNANFMVNHQTAQL